MCPFINENLIGIWPKATFSEFPLLCIQMGFRYFLSFRFFSALPPPNRVSQLQNSQSTDELRSWKAHKCKNSECSPCLVASDTAVAAHGGGEILEVWTGVVLLFSCSVVSDSLRLHELKHARPPCPSSPRAYSNSCPLNWWYHPTVLSSVVPFSSCLQSFPATGSFPMNQLFASGGQSIRASASVLTMNIQGWFPSGLAGLISL